MGKKTKTILSKSTEALDTEVAKKYSDLKQEGNQCFAKKDYLKAIELYDQASKVLPEGAVEKADLVSNKAACYLLLKRFKDAAKEASNALQLQPNHLKALQRRAKAYESQGLYKQALSDIQAYNKTDAATDESKETEKRLKDLMSGRKLGGSASANGAGALGANRAPARPQQPFYVTAKCTYNSVTKLIHMSPSTSYADFYAMVKAKFPEAVPFLIKYADKEGDLVTLTCKADIQMAITELAIDFQRSLAGSHASRIAQNVLPSLRVVVTRVASEAEVPKPPEEEEQDRQKMLQQQKQLQAKLTGKKEETQEVYEIDEWLLEFANLFRDMTGIDPDKHIDLHNEGWDKVSKAMEATLQSDKALPIFDAAAAKFAEVTATGLLNWGNVFICIAHKFLDEAATTGAALDGIRDKVLENFKLAEAKYHEALGHKADFFDGLCALGQLEFERAKVAAGLLMKPVRGPPVDEETDPREAERLQAETAAAANAVLVEALALLKEDGVVAAEPHMQLARGWFDKAVASAPDKKDKADKEEGGKDEGDKEEGKVEGEGEGAKANGVESAPEAPKEKDGKSSSDMSLRSQAQIMYGNILYEWSQLLAAVAREWRPALDEAVSQFTAAGCSPADIRNALKNHTQKEHLDLGPDPEPEPEATPAAVAEKAPEVPAPEAKGLPSLELKKGKKAGGK